MTLAILADDLTGACDAAAPFARRGLETDVVLDLAALNVEAGTAPPAGVAVDADTRRLGRRLAGARTGQAARALRAAGATLLYKKIDSTLRGHVAAELAATLRAWDAPLAIVCPAFPAVGRWVQDGHLFVDKRGDLGDVAALVGLGDSTLGGGTRTELGRRVGRIGLDLVAGGSDAVVEALERARRDGARVVVADANTPGHLTALASAATRLKPSALLVGSAGLAAALAELRSAADTPHGDGWTRDGSSIEATSAGQSGRPEAATVRDAAGADATGARMPWLVVCGSQTEVTQHQVVELARAGARVIELDVDELLARRRLAASAGDEAARLLWAGATPVLRLVVRPDGDGLPSRGPRQDDRAARRAPGCRGWSSAAARPRSPSTRSSSWRGPARG